jgi:thiamine pyrophosphate-dependent acetolactate synthase large subunit-like protein
MLVLASGKRVPFRCFEIEVAHSVRPAFRRLWQGPGAVLVSLPQHASEQEAAAQTQELYGQRAFPLPGQPAPVLAQQRLGPVSVVLVRLPGDKRSVAESA